MMDPEFSANFDINSVYDKLRAISKGLQLSIHSCLELFDLDDPADVIRFKHNIDALESDLKVALTDVEDIEREIISSWWCPHCLLRG